MKQVNKLSATCSFTQAVDCAPATAANLNIKMTIAAYLLMLVLPWLRFVALGLLIHMGLDGLECIRLALS